MNSPSFKKVVVLGAAGKMGSGIALLLLQHLPEIEDLILVDPNLKGLKQINFREQLRKFAEKQINLLRKVYADFPNLVSNAEIIEYFIQTTVNKVRFATTIAETKNATLIFEAIVESAEIKCDLFRQIKEIAHPEALFLTNTSSIPIHLLNEKAELDNRIIGFHFYNPPPVQKLLELIIPKKCDPKLASFAKELAARLEKIVVYSADVAGFIGNGMMLPEIKFACNMVRELDFPSATAIYLINKVTRDYLMRPMGIFELIDYVGLDIADSIAKIMDETLTDPLISEMVNKGKFFQEGKIYSDGSYVEIDPSWDQLLGNLPKQWLTWRELKGRKEKISEQLQWIQSNDSLGADLARKFLQQNNATAEALLSNGVALSVEDINTVLKNGFYHLYGVQSHERV